MYRDTASVKKREREKRNRYPNIQFKINYIYENRRKEWSIFSTIDKTHCKEKKYPDTFIRFSHPFEILLHKYFHFESKY